MNYILVSSSAAQRGPQRVDFSEPTYIDYYTEGTTATLLEAQLYGMFVVSPQITPTYIGYNVKSTSPTSLEAVPERDLMADSETVTEMEAMPYLPPQGFSYNYTVNMPPLAVLEFLKQHGYQVIGTNTIEDTCIWTLHKQTVTTEQSTPQTTAEQSTPQTTDQSTPHQTTEQSMQRMQRKKR